MNPAVKTLVFVGVALASTIAAVGAHKAYQVDLTKKITDEGSEFFPDFTDPNKATSLQVAAYDKANARVNDFKVEFKDGQWQIPSHNNYPADGKDRLRETAASVIGVKREVQVGESADDHRRYNLLDPLSDKNSGSDGVGTRITLKNADTTLVDFIVGKKVENVGQDVYYIRKADEARYYRANLGKFDISTKFSDWIEPDLLQVSSADIKEIGIDRFKIDFVTGEQSEQETSDLRRDKQGGEWSLEGLDAEKEKVKTSVVDEILRAVDDLKIVGVRRKPAPLASLLRGEKQKVTQGQLIELQLDMQSKGFLLQNGVIPTSGSVSAGTFEGIAYRLDFGNVFSGSDLDIEVGGAAEKAAAETAAKPAAEGEKKEGEAAKDEAKEDKKDDKLAKNRYVFIQTRFDDKLLAEAPKPPVKPEPPKDEPAPPAAEEKPAEEKKDAEAKPDDAAAEKKDAAEAKPEEPKTDETKPPVDPAVAKKAAQEKYELALKDYELEQEVYETKKKEYDEKVKATKKKIERLNARFADWYFVVSEDVYEGLRAKKSDLSEPKDAGKAPGVGGAPMIPQIPGLPGLSLPGGKKDDAPAATPEDKPAADAAPKEDAPKADAAKPEDKDAAKPDAPPAEKPPEAKPDEPKAEAAPEAKPEAAAPEKQ
jgi:hypothetical protein